MTGVRWRAVAAEFIGTAFLLAGIVGSGIMAANLTDDVGLQLLQNALATAGVLTAVILAFGSVSGAHLNPAVTIADRVLGGIGTGNAVAYVAAQLTGGILGVIVANVMFDLPLVTVSTTSRAGVNLVFAEAIATFGLLVVIFGVVRTGAVQVVAFAVGAYIAGAYYFTSSTSFANPAVTVARMFSDTFAGIEPASVPGFIVGQLAATAAAIVVIGLLYPDVGEFADDVILPHPTG